MWLNGGFGMDVMKRRRQFFCATAPESSLFNAMVFNPEGNLVRYNLVQLYHRRLSL
jgi:hypothetical protein